MSQARTSTDERAVQALRAELWRLGLLSWKLHPGQLDIYREMMTNPSPRFVLEIARRFGKTFLFVLIAVEICLRNPGGRVVFSAPSLKHLEEFVLPAFEKVVEDAPADCRPKFNSQSGHWTFPNKSYVHLFGADDKRKANRGRGPEALAFIADEAGFFPAGLLTYVLRSIARPQLLHTGGRTFIGSTPAEEPDHDFSEIAERAEAQGNYARRTIHDNPLLTTAQIQKFIAEDAKEEGLSEEDYVKTDEFRREYMAERVINKMLVVVPEWDAARTRLIQNVPRPEYFKAQTVLDFGGADPHAVHFGYWHPGIGKQGAYVIEDELLLRDDENTAELAAAVKKKEDELWGVRRWEGTLAIAQENKLSHLLDNLPEWMTGMLNADAEEQPWARWADNNLALVRDLYELHGVAFIPTAKDQKQLQVNNLRVLIREGQFVVHPRCVHTDRHIRGTTWKDHKRKEFARKGGEHGDLVDCAVYGTRNLDKRDATPPGLVVLGNVTVGTAYREQMKREEHARGLAEAIRGTSRLARKLGGKYG